nr:SHOCT domain-containing protein [Sphingomonas melonis]
MGGFGGMIVGGLLLGFFVAVISASSATHSAKKPPRVRVAPSRRVRATPAYLDPSQPQRDQADPVARLKRLDNLKSEGIVTEEEYQRQRASIVGSL